jgi:kumamolisin
MRRLTALALALAVGGCSGAEPAPSGYQPVRVSGARDVGAADRDQVIDLVISLSVRDQAALKTLIAQQNDPGSSRFQKYVTPAEFGDQFGPSVADYQRVLDWAAGAGLEVTRQEPSRMSLSVRGRIADIERAFGTSLRTFEDGRGRFRAPDASFRRPDAIGDVFSSVIGLDDSQLWHTHYQALPPPANPEAGATGSRAPADLRAQYQVDQTPFAGDGQTVAILGTGYPPDAVKDVPGFIKKYALPTNAAAQYTQVFIGGPNRDPDTLAQNEQGENVLDIDCVLGVAPKANVVHVFTAENGGGLFYDGISYIINNVPQAHAVTVSYGLCERWVTSAVLLLENQFQQAKAQGQTWFFASGDNGTDDCQDGSGNHTLNTEWPASSPSAVGVGGTNISLPSFTETAWNGGGGGQSEVFTKPDYQIGVGPYPNDGVRDVPDIAAVAGSPGIAVYQGGGVGAAEGTSAATPIVAAIWSLLDQSQGGKGLTNFHERIYALGKAGSTGFHDITSGSNPGPGTKGYSAVPGYDLATGWGTPNLKELVNQW